MTTEKQGTKKASRLQNGNLLYDGIMIGAGVIGCSIAYHLAAFQGRFLVLEAKSDLCEGTSKANSGIAHGGYDAVPGTMKARMNMEGIRMMPHIAKTLDFDYQQIGSLVLCHDEADRVHLDELMQRGKKNGVEGLQIVEREALREMEPNVAEDVVCALFCPNAGIVDPFQMNSAFAEQAAANGVSFQFDQPVTDVRLEADGCWTVCTETQRFRTRAVVNAAGVYSDQIHGMVSEERVELKPRRGEYLLLDRHADGLVRHVVFDLPSKRGKGVLVTPTIARNTLLGPTSDFISSKEGTETTAQGLEMVKQQASAMIQHIPLDQVITSFSGLRAHEAGDDFILREVKPGFFDCVGIESPGLTSAPAIGRYMAGLVSERLHLQENKEFVAERKRILSTWSMSIEEKQALVARDPAYGQIICRCESVTEGEILEAIRRSPGATTLDGIKRRVRATAGRCQGGFCTPGLIAILARELGKKPEEITKKGWGSALLFGRTRQEVEHE